ncbi:hypothetical protein D3C81_1399550 [compost metagenome]
MAIWLSGSAMAVGLPLSACSRISIDNGSEASSSTPYWLASFSPPPSPNRCSAWPQFEQICTAMFSTTPNTGILTLRNISTPFLASIRARSCGVVTITEPATGTFCARVSWISPVPGGMSITR